MYTEFFGVADSSAAFGVGMTRRIEQGDPESFSANPKAAADFAALTARLGSRVLSKRDQNLGFSAAHKAHCAADAGSWPESAAGYELSAGTSYGLVRAWASLASVALAQVDLPAPAVRQLGRPCGLSLQSSDFKAIIRFKSMHPLADSSHLKLDNATLKSYYELVDTCQAQDFNALIEV